MLLPARPITNNPSVVLDVVDGTAHMAGNKKKDAVSIVKWMLPSMEVIDPER